MEKLLKKTTSLLEIDEITGGNIRPEHYYEWGDEPSGYVTTGLYLDDVWYNTGIILKIEAEQSGLTYHCPYN